MSRRISEKTYNEVFKFKPQTSKLNPLVKETIEEIQQNAVLKEIVSINRVPKGASVFADPDMLSTMLRNLCSNAIKFTKPGGEIKVGYDLKPNRMRKVWVEDNGVGISKERIDTLFDVATNSSTRGTGQEGGTGLGLILCKEFMDKHNGDIQVQSTVGLGSTFTISFPYGKE